MSSQNFKDVTEVSHMLEHQFALYNHVVYVDFNVLTHLRLKHSGHHSLVGGTCVLQIKGHHLIVVVSNGCNESCLFLVFYG